MPVVVVTGPRQVGKSTLALHTGTSARRYQAFDDLDVVGLARRDPGALLGGDLPVTIDEIQRSPELLHAIKRATDRERIPGRFVLTGSANLLMRSPRTGPRWHGAGGSRPRHCNCTTMPTGPSGSTTMCAPREPRAARPAGVARVAPRAGGTGVLAVPWWRVL